MALNERRGGYFGKELGKVYPELVVVGHIINETIQYPDRTIAPVLGSPVAYTSVIASRLGTKTGIVTKIGKDWPDQLLEPIRDAHVDTRGIIVTHRSTRNLLIYDEVGKKQARYLDKAPPITASDVPEEYLKAKILYICPMDEEVPRQAIEKLCTYRGTLAVELMGYGGATSTCHPSLQEQINPTALRELTEHFAIVKGSDEDCQYLFGNGITPEKAAILFVEWGARVGIVTCGSSGAIVVTEESTYTIPAFKTQVVDLTGAGDAFSAGFFSEYLRTQNAYKAALFASATASCVIAGTGGVIAARMPTREQVYQKMRMRPENKPNDREKRNTF